MIGGSGFLGREVIRQARRSGSRVVATFHHRAPQSTIDVEWRQLDIRNRHEIANLVRRTQPEAIINTAFRKADWATTADGAMYVAMAAAADGVRLVHVSSDAVFAGRALPYDETSSPDPTTPYGAAKAAAETAVRGIHPAAVVARTSLIVGDGNSPREAQVRALATNTTTGALFADEVRCPVHVHDLASALVELADSPYSGIHHLAGTDAVNRHELGVLIARRDALDETKLPAGLRAVSGLPGALEVRLDSTMTQSRLKTRLRGAYEFIGSYPGDRTRNGSDGPA